MSLLSIKFSRKYLFVSEKIVNHEWFHQGSSKICIICQKTTGSFDPLESAILCNGPKWTSSFPDLQTLILEAQRKREEMAMFHQRKDERKDSERPIKRTVRTMRVSHSKAEEYQPAYSPETRRALREFRAQMMRRRMYPSETKKQELERSRSRQKKKKCQVEKREKHQIQKKGLDNSVQPTLKEMVEKYICPITAVLMTNPCITPCKHYFERQALQKYLLIDIRCPLCRAPIKASQLVNSVQAKKDIKMVKKALRRQGKDI